MRQKTFWLAAIIGVLLIIGSGGAAMAQTSTEPVLSGYFVSINWQPTGPFDTAGLRQLISSGQLSRDTLVWKEGMANWAAAGTVAELAPLLSASPPPLPGAPPPLAAPPPVAPHQQQAAQQSAQDEPWGGHPAIAGWVNMFLGIWSFTNDDFPGGLVTAGFQVSGVAASIIGNSLYRTWYWSGGSYATAQIIYFVGYGLTATGAVYGFYRGFTQYSRKMAAARSFAEAISDNPLNNITLVAYPAFDERRVAGALTYSLSY